MASDLYFNGNKIYFPNSDVTSNIAGKEIIKLEGRDSITNLTVRFTLEQYFGYSEWRNNVNGSVIYVDSTNALFSLKFDYAADPSLLPATALTLAQIATYFDQLGGGAGGGTGLTPAQIAQLNGAIQSTEKGANNGVATLDSSGKIPASQLPTNVQTAPEIIAVANAAGLPATGVEGKLYITKDDDKTLLWDVTTSTYKPQTSDVSILAYTNLAGFPATGIEGKMYIAKDTDLVYVWDVTTATYKIPTPAGAETDPVFSAAKDTDGTLTANSDTKIATQKAVKTYVDNGLASASGLANFSSTKSYTTGQTIIQTGKIYQANGAISAGAFNATQWTELSQAYQQVVRGINNTGGISTFANSPSDWGQNTVLTGRLQVGFDGVADGPQSTVDIHGSLGGNVKLISDATLTGISNYQMSDLDFVVVIDNPALNEIELGNPVSFSGQFKTIVNTLNVPKAFTLGLPYKDLTGAIATVIPANSVIQLVCLRKNPTTGNWWQQISGGSVASAASGITQIAKVLNISASALASTPLFTVPTGKKLVITSVLIKVNTATGPAVTTPPQISVGGNSTTFDDFMLSQTLTGAVTAGSIWRWQPNGSGVEYAATNVINAKVNTIQAGATALTYDIEVYGNLV
jgi:hypothetical protein